MATAEKLETQDDLIETAVGQLSLVSAAMKMMLEACERELLAAAEEADPGPEPARDWARTGSRRDGGRSIRRRLRAR
ncbi:hypothetical protein L6V77_16440 [Myxococcota bacterium]|jgi:hypothetical protein|nr:hypothetical protein [Myxococcota bacterium]